MNVLYVLIGVVFVAGLMYYYRPRMRTPNSTLVIDHGGRMSPIEREFTNAYRETGAPLWYQLEREYSILGGKYRIDFVHLPTKTAIELDGYAWHQGKGIDKITADYKRRRELQRLGWHFISFTGQETYTPALALRAALELQDMLKRNK